MKKASIVSIGNEILTGQTVDTNASYMSRKLLSIGIPVVSIYTARDEIDAIASTLQLAGADADVVLATGGLGPTDDDVTRQAFAKFLDANLQLDEQALAKIESFFRRRNREMAATNKAQAYIPAGANALANEHGTAPGIIADKQGKIFVAMPGVPAEMKAMFEECVLDRLQEFAGRQAIVVRKIRCYGTGESNIAELLGPLMQRSRNPLINCTAGRGVITLHIIATAAEKIAAEQMAVKDEELLVGKLGKVVFGTGEQTLAEVVGAALDERQKTLAVAESCTGGLLAQLLTDIPGASTYFMGGWICYSNQSKSRELGVAADLIETKGAVSGSVAEAMAKGARKKASTDFAIAITGIAGPGGGTEEKPVGLVYISVCSQAAAETKRFIFFGERRQIRSRAAFAALNMLRLQMGI